MLVGNILIGLMFLILTIFPANSQKRLRNLLLASVSVSLFINIGYFITPSLSYGAFSMLYYLSASYFIKRNSIASTTFKRSVCLLAFAIAGLSLAATLLASLFGENVEVIPLSTKMDDVYTGVSSTASPSITKSNIVMMIFLLAFFAYSLSASDVIRTKGNFDWLCDKLLLIFHVAMVVALVEYVLNNYVQPYIFREWVYSVFGVADLTKTYDGSMRYGRYGFSLLFTEQSYVFVFLAYYAIQVIRKNVSNLNLVWVSFSVVVLYLNGSTTGVMLMPMGLIALVYLASKRITIRVSFFSMFVVVGLAIACAVFLSSDRGSQLLTITADRLIALLNGGSYSTNLETSSAIRNFGNSVALRAWEMSPIIGLGLGTTRAYGFLTSSLVSFGVLGLVLYFLFLKEVFGCAIKSAAHLLLLVAVLSYLVIGLNINYVCSPAILAFVLPFIDIRSGRLETSHVALCSSSENKDDSTAVKIEGVI